MKKRTERTERTTAAICMDPAFATTVLPTGLRNRLREFVDLLPDLAPDEIAATPLAAPAREALARTDVLVTGWGCPPLGQAVLEAAPRLRAVVHAAGSVRALLPPPAWQRGLEVSSAAEANAGPVAEFTYALITLAGKAAWQAAASHRLGRWDDSRRVGCDGRTVGVIGASRIGRRVIDGLRRSPAGYRILLADPYVSSEEAATLGAESADLDDLCRRSSIVTVHAPELPATQHLLDAKRLALIPDGGTVINTARGSLIDTDALTRECGTGRLNAWLDVTSPEPLPAGHPLFRLPNVVVTPHIAGAQGSEVERLGAYAVEEVGRFVHGEAFRGRVTPEDLTRIA